MKHRGKSIALVVAGILLGGALAGPAAYATAGVWAERNVNMVYVDGRLAELEAYNIDGSNYVRLRDVGALIGFNVYYDGAVRIESGTPYTGEAPSATDYSQAANPAVLNEVYTHEAYNAASEVLAGVRAGNLSRTGQVFYADPEDARRYERILTDLANGTTLSLRGVDRSGLYEVYAHTIDWSAADAATEKLIREVSQLPTDREKVVRLNDWICDRVIYNPKVVVGVNEIATSPEPVEGNCSSFARMLNYLCGRLGIPCLRVAGESHAWNLVYADGAWGYVDVSLNDQVRNRDAMLFAETARKRSSDPEGVRFLQELLVPGSTK